MSQSGGVAGLRPRAREGTADPGTPLHAAACAVLTAAATDATPDDATRRRPDAFAYRVAIDGPDGPLLAATYREPVPPELAALLEALDALDAGRP